MFRLHITQADEKWLHRNYPALKIEETEKGIVTIKGKLQFDMIFCGKNHSPPYIINPKEDHFGLGERIQDQYEIKIKLKPGEYSHLPRVYELGGRIKDVSRKKGVSLVDLHINSSRDGSACLCPRAKEPSYLPEGFNLPDYFNNLLIPFFYAQSYFESNGEWRWGDYEHGIAGILESCLECDQTEQDVKLHIDDIKNFCNKNDDQNFNFYRYQLKQSQIKGRNKCPVCKSDERWEDCHSKSLEGIRFLKKLVDCLQIDI